MDDLTRAELAEQRDFLLASIRDLDDELAAGDLSEADHRALRDDYTARAATVLRRLEGLDGLDGSGQRPPAPRRPSAGGRRLAVGAAVGLLAVAAGLAVASSAGERLPGDPSSGSVEQGISGRLARARQLIGSGDAADAVELYDEILEENPRQVEALAYRGWVVHLAGLSDKGLEYLDRAVAADPGYPDAHFFRGMVLWRAKGDPAAAAAEFRLFLANNPPPDMVELVEDSLERALAEAEAADGAADPSADPAPEGGG